MVEKIQKIRLICTGKIKQDKTVNYKRYLILLMCHCLNMVPILKLIIMQKYKYLEVLQLCTTEKLLFSALYDQDLKDVPSLQNVV